MAASADPQLPDRRLQLRLCRRRDALLDFGDDDARLLDAAMDHQPAWALGHKLAQEQDEDAEHRADAEAAVDDDIGPATITSRDQLLDRRVDRRALAADTGAREKAKRRKAPETPGECRRRRRQEVEAQRDGEEALATPTVGQ